MPDTTSLPATGRARPWQSIQRIIGERVEAKRSAGIVAGVADSGRRRVAAYGDPGPGQPPLDADSVFEVGSITKVFTAALLADMVARREVSLDEPVASSCPRPPACQGRGSGRSSWWTWRRTPRGCRGCRATCGGRIPLIR